MQSALESNSAATQFQFIRALDLVALHQLTWKRVIYSAWRYFHIKEKPPGNSLIHTEFRVQGQDLLEVEPTVSYLFPLPFSSVLFLLHSLLASPFCVITWRYNI